MMTHTTDSSTDGAMGARGARNHEITALANAMVAGPAVIVREPASPPQRLTEEVVQWLLVSIPTATIRAAEPLEVETVTDLGESGWLDTPTAGTADWRAAAEYNMAAAVRLVVEASYHNGVAAHCLAEALKAQRRDGQAGLLGGAE